MSDEPPQPTAPLPASDTAVDPVDAIEAPKRLGFLGNAGITLITTTVTMIVSLALSPFIVHELGLRVFGFWALVSALTQYQGLLDLGIGIALARFVAVHGALDERERIDRLSAAAVAVTGPIAAAVVLVSIVVVLVLPGSWTDTWPAHWQLTVVTVSGALSCSLLASVLLAFPRGLERWDLQSLASLVYQLVFGACTLVTLLAGAGIEGLGFSTLAGGLAMFAVAFTIKRRLWPQRILGRAHWADVKELVGYSANLQVSSLTMIVNAQADKPMILAVGGSLQFVGLYELASRVAAQARYFPFAVLGPLTVRLAHETAGKPLAVARPLYDWALRHLIALGVAPMLAFYGVCYPLVMAWLGPSFEGSSQMVALLGLGYAVNLMTGAGTALANAAGRPDLERNYCLIALATNLSLSALLGALVGPWGVVVATMTGLIVSAIWFLWRVQAWLADGTGWTTDVLREGLPNLAVGLAFGVLPIVLTRLTGLTGRIELLGLGIVCGLLLLASLVVTVPQVRQLLGKVLGRGVPVAE
ncbi:MAG: oligosaccharide flippase family protein [Solirubrobacteraceae bacterium]|nr:oligosaccharide flippase family protein [Patulibacter sp.]